MTPIGEGIPWWANRPIPGPDPGGCPTCGGWRKAGLSHDCDAERRYQESFIDQIVSMMRETHPDQAEFVEWLEELERRS